MLAFPSAAKPALLASALATALLLPPLGHAQDLRIHLAVEHNGAPVAAFDQVLREDTASGCVGEPRFYSAEEVERSGADPAAPFCDGWRFSASSIPGKTRNTVQISWTASLKGSGSSNSGEAQSSSFGGAMPIVPGAKAVEAFSEDGYVVRLGAAYVKGAAKASAP